MEQVIFSWIWSIDAHFETNQSQFFFFIFSNFGNDAVKTDVAQPQYTTRNTKSRT